MSAISGIYYRSSSTVEDRQHLSCNLKRLNKSMDHHGSDGSGIWLGAQCGLAQQHTHYYSNPPVDAHPYHEAMHQITVVGHSRLFNQSELKKQLGGIDEGAMRDQQALIALAYLKWGLEFPNHLLGEFSILLWDGRRERLLALVDHFNSRSLYYYLNNKHAVIASEITALHCLPSVPRSVNFSKIARNDWLTFQLEPGETGFANLYFIPAAHQLVIDKSNHFLQQYWHPTLKKAYFFHSNDEFREAFQEKFSQAVQATTDCHLPVCLQLSGGLDSSAIAVMYATRNAQTSRPLICLSNVLPSSYQGVVQDEKEYLALIQKNNLIKVPVIDEWRGPFDHLERFTENLYTSPQSYQHRAINDVARRYGAKLILHGTLGEITSSYAGHEYLAELFCRGRWIKLVHELMAHQSLYNQSGHRIFLSRVLKPLLPRQLTQPVTAGNRYRLLANSFIRADYLAATFSKETLELITAQFLQAGQLRSIDARYNAFTQLNWFLQHASHIFNQVNDASKPAVYLSNPYFDKRFVEFCLHVPNQFRFHNGYPRSIIRIGMQNLLPDTIGRRLSKTPFLPDYAERYYRQLPLAKATLDELATHKLVQHVIDVKRLQTLIQAAYSAKRDDEQACFMNFQVIPRTIYLALFLSSF